MMTMFSSWKSKMLATIVIAAASLLISVTAFAGANTITINSAKTSGNVVLSDTAQAAPEVTKADLITVDATISTGGADVTMLVTSALSAPSVVTITPADIFYINQDTSNTTTGKCSFTFRMPIQAAAGTYAIYISGAGVDTPSVKYMRLGATGEQYLSGDFDSSGAVKLADAIYILSYSVGYEQPSGVTWDVDAGDVDGSGTVDLADAIYVLRYAAGYTQPPAGVTTGQILARQ